MNESRSSRGEIPTTGTISGCSAKYSASARVTDGEGSSATGVLPIQAPRISVPITRSRTPRKFIGCDSDERFSIPIILQIQQFVAICSVSRRYPTRGDDGKRYLNRIRRPAAQYRRRLRLSHRREVERESIS